MSNLLMDERPIVISPKLADAVGLGESIVLQQIHYWLEKSENIHDGRKWIFNSYAKWKEQFIFWSESTIKRTITSLEKKEVLISGNFNKKGFDKTKWYTIDYEKLKLLEAEYEIKKAKEKAEKQAKEQATNRTGQVDPTNGSDCTNRTGQVDPTNGSDCTVGTGQVDPTNTIDYTETTTEITSETTTTTNTSSQQTNDFENLYQFYKANIHDKDIKKISPAITKMIKQDLENFTADLIQYAMDETAIRSITSYGYVRSILKRCKQEGIETREQAEQKAERKNNGINHQKSNQSYEKTPEWINNQQQEKKLSAEEEAELEIERQKLKEELKAMNGGVSA